MAGTRMLERLTPQDLLMVWPGDFGWPEDIAALGILDGAGLLDAAGQVQVELVRRRLEPKLHLVPRFRQLLYRPRWELGVPLWVDAPARPGQPETRPHAAVSDCRGVAPEHCRPLHAKAYRSRLPATDAQ